MNKKIIIGLGNKGRKYKNTRHNAGFIVVDFLSDFFSIPVSNKRKYYKIGKGNFEYKEIVLIKPMTYMNLSGTAVSRIVKREGVDVTKDLLVIYDDVDLQLGNIRFKAKGSAGGHNGIKSIISALGTNEFPRLRLGIAGRGKGYLNDHVLTSFKPDEWEVFQQVVETSKEAVVDFINEIDFEKIMAQYNKKQENIKSN